MKKRRRRGLYALITLIVLLGGGFGFVRWYFTGPRFGQFLANLLFHDARGRVVIDRIDWPVPGIFQRYLDVDLHGLHVFDPHGDEVLTVDHLTAKVDWISAVLPGHSITADDLVVDHAVAMVRAYPTPGGPFPFEVGFVAAFQPRPRPGGGHGKPVPGPTILVRSLALAHVKLTLDFPVWGAVVDDISADGGTLRVSFAEAPKLDFSFILEHTRAPHATIKIAGIPAELTDFEADKLGQFPLEKDSLAFDLRARTMEGGDLHAAGNLAHVYDPVPGHSGVELALDLHHAGKSLERLSQGIVGGDAAVSFDISGPMITPRMQLAVRGAQLEKQVPATIDHVVASLDLATSLVTLDELDVHALGGRAVMKGTGSMLGRTVTDLSVDITQPMNLAAYLPPAAVEEAGSTRVFGKLHVRGVLGALDADRLDFDLGRVRVRGAARLLGQTVNTRGLEVTLPEGHATVRGSYGLASGKLNLDFDAAAPEMLAILKRLKLPAVATSVTAKGRVTGTVAMPVVTADASVVGVPMVPHVDAKLSYRWAPGGGFVEVVSLTGDPLGGTLAASGGVVLGRGVAPRLLDVRLEAAALDLAHIPGTGGNLTGYANFMLDARGPLLQPEGSIDLKAGLLHWNHKDLGMADVQLAFDERHGVAVKRFHLGGPDDGSLDITGSFGLDKAHQLDLDVALAQLPLGLVPFVLAPDAAAKLGVTGTGDLQAHLGGDLAHPTVLGHVAALALGVVGLTLGDSKLEFTPLADGRIGFKGQLLHGKLQVDGSLLLSPGKPPSIALRAAFDQVELQEFLPDLAARVGARCRITGYIEAQSDPQLRAELHLSRVRFDLDSENADGEPVPIVVENRGEIVVALDAQSGTATLLQPISFVSPSGDFTVEGFAGAKQLGLRLHGQIQLGLLDFYLRRYVDHATGTVLADVTVKGTPEHPKIDGEIIMRDAALRRAQQETEVKLPSGSIKLSSERIDVEQVILEVDGNRLALNGHVDLVDFRPVRIDAHLDGRVAGKLLEIAAPDFVSGAGGYAILALALTGDAASPAFQGTLTIDGGLSLVPRGFRKEITLHAGELRFANQRLTLEHVTGDVEDGRLEVNGEMQLANYAPVSMVVNVDLEGYNHRIPEVLELEVNSHLKLTMQRGQLFLGGDVDVIDGAFIQKLRLEHMIVPERTKERTEPFWKASPLLADMSLNLHLQTTGSFEVHNEIAKSLSLSGDVFISGTPQRPVLSGEVHVLEGGTVTIPTTKVKEFTVRQGEISFSPYRAFPDQTPNVSLKADTTFVDVEQTEHIVYLELTGTLSGFQWHLSTNTGLNEAQTLSLITTGRSTSSLRARYRGEGGLAVGAAADVAAAAALAPGASSVYAFSDEIAKTFTGEFISVLIEDPVKNFLSLDCFHLGVGASSITSSFCKNFGPGLVLNAEFEQGFGWYRLVGTANLKAFDDFFIVVQGSNIKSPQEAEGVQTDFRLQLKYKFIVP